MIHVLLGMSCSGKTTLLKQLEEEHGMNRIITITTRPIRENEVDGEDYHFVSQEIYNLLDKLNGLVAQRTFISANGDEWNYAIITDSLKTEENSFLILDPEGYKELKNNREFDIKGVYLKAPGHILRTRGLVRGDNIKELERRLIADSKDFEGIESEVDYVVNYNEVYNILDLLGLSK